MPVLITSQTATPPAISLTQLRQRAERLLSLCGCSRSELSILLIDDPEMAQLNEQYRNKQGPTNVLAFAMQEGGGEHLPEELLGDVIISLDTAAREAATDRVTLHQRVTIPLIHGLLHLLGFDHERSRSEERVMAEREKQLLNQLLNEERRGKMVSLAINVDHVATLRQARGISEPDPVLAAGICELAGAQGIVVHLREDRRHIQDRDVRLLRQTVKSKLNLEMGATEEIIAIALEIKPDMITLVPEKRKELTTEGGLNVAGQKKKLQEIIARMRKANIPVSLFIDPDSRQISTAHEVGATFVEIHTGRYCDAITEQLRDQEFALIATAAEEAYEMGLRVNAGHGLNYLNTRRVAALGTIEELSIGHAVMARAILVGLDQAVREMLALLPAA
ncbi:MAG: pyridoxine 5'-phosphate synthase [Pseudomonadota bacterium]